MTAACVAFVFFYGRPMVMYEKIHELSEYSQVPDLGDRLWSARTGWRFAEAIDTMLVS